MIATKAQGRKTGSKGHFAEGLDRRDLDRIRLVVGESRDQARADLCAILKGMRFSRVSAFDNIDQVRLKIADNLADLVICAVDIEGGDVRSMVRDVRLQKLGKNPFVFVIYIINVGNAEFIRTCIDSGADDLILRPISAATISDRITALAKDRKPFVVTRDYIGPDRRKAERVSGGVAPKLEAPNIFSYLKNGSRGKGFYSDNVKKGAARLKDLWAERQALQVAYLIEQALPILAQRPVRADEITKVFVDDFHAVAQAAESSVIGTRYASEDIVLHTLSTVMIRACAAEIPAAEDLTTLGKLAQIVRKTFAGETTDQPKKIQINAKATPSGEITGPASPVEEKSKEAAGTAL